MREGETGLNEIEANDFLHRLRINGLAGAGTGFYPRLHKGTYPSRTLDRAGNAWKINPKPLAAILLDAASPLPPPACSCRLTSRATNGTTRYAAISPLVPSSALTSTDSIAPIRSGQGVRGKAVPRKSPSP